MNLLPQTTDEAVGYLLGEKVGGHFTDSGSKGIATAFGLYGITGPGYFRMLPVNGAGFGFKSSDDPIFDKIHVHSIELFDTQI